MAVMQADKHHHRGVDVLDKSTNQLSTTEITTTAPAVLHSLLILGTLGIAIAPTFLIQRFAIKRGVVDLRGMEASTSAGAAGIYHVFGWTEVSEPRHKRQRTRAKY